MTTLAKEDVNWIGFLGICLIAFPAFLDFTIVNTALPDIQRYFSASVLSLQWVINIYGMMLASVMIVAGRLADILGRRGVLYLGAGIFAIAALGGGFSSSIDWVIAFRLLMGVGASFVFILPISIIPQTVGENNRQRCIGYYSAITGLGMAVGPFLGGVLVQYLSWRWVMWINLPFLLLGLLMAVSSIRGPSAKIKDAKLDFLVAGMVLATVILIVNGIIQISHHGLVHWNSGGLIVLSVLLGIGVVYRERHHAHPLLDFSIFKIPLLLLTIFAILAGAVAAYVLFFYDPLFLDVVFGLSPFALGLMLLGMPIGQVVVSFVSGRLVEKFGLSTLMFVAIIATLISTLGHAFFSLTTPHWFVFAAFVLMGITVGLANVGLASSVFATMPEEKAGTAIGTLGTIWNLAGSIVLAVATVTYYKSAHSSLFTAVKDQFPSLSATQSNAIEAVAHTPTKASLLANAFSGSQLTSITADLKDGFIAGLHSIAWLYLVVMIVLAVVGLVVLKVGKKG